MNLFSLSPALSLSTLQTAEPVDVNDLPRQEIFAAILTTTRVPPSESVDLAAVADAPNNMSGASHAEQRNVDTLRPADPQLPSTGTVLPVVESASVETPKSIEAAEMHPRVSIADEQQQLTVVAGYQVDHPGPTTVQKVKRADAESLPVLQVPASETRIDAVPTTNESTEPPIPPAISDPSQSARIPRVREPEQQIPVPAMPTTTSVATETRSLTAQPTETAQAKPVARLINQNGDSETLIPANMPREPRAPVAVPSLPANSGMATELQQPNPTAVPVKVRSGAAESTGQGNVNEPASRSVRVQNPIESSALPIRDLPLILERQAQALSPGFAQLPYQVKAQPNLANTRRPTVDHKVTNMTAVRLDTHRAEGASPLSQYLETAAGTGLHTTSSADSSREHTPPQIAQFVPTHGSRVETASASGVPTLHAAAAQSPQPAVADDVHARVMRVIADRRVGQNSVTVQLNPASLGNIEISFLKDGDGDVNITIVTREPQVREFIDQFVPRVRQLLQESGVSLGSLDVEDEAQQQGFTGSGEHTDGESQSVVDERPPELSNDNPGSEAGFYTTV